MDKLQRVFFRVCSALPVVFFLSACIENPASTSKGGANRFGVASSPTPTPTPTNSNTGGAEQPATVSAVALNGPVKAIKKQRDGYFLVGGEFTIPPHLTRIDSTGTLDATFNTNIGTGTNGTILTLAVQSDEKILIGGEFTDFNGSPAGRIARLNKDGTVDLAFLQAIGTGFNDRVSNLTVLGNGKILVVGNFTEFNGATVVRVVRLNGSGTLDDSFGMTQSSPGASPTVSPTPTPSPSKDKKK